MAEYKGIKGFKVQYLDQDPVPAVTAWASSGNMNSGRYFLAPGGTQTATLAAGGTTSTPVGPGITGATEEYNGATWASNPTGLIQQDLV